MNTKRILLTLIAALTVLLAACAPAATPTPADPATIVQRYYDAVNKKELDTAMTFIADDVVFVNPYGKFAGKDEVRASLQLVMDDGITFDLSNFRGTSGRVVYDYMVKVNGEAVETGTDGLTIVRNGKITLDATERWEWAAYVNNVTFTVQDDGFSGPDSIAAGWAEITLTNNSQGAHHIQLVKLDAGKTPDDLKAALEADPENFPAWAIPYGGPNAPDPGGSTSAIVRLDAGNYALISVIPNAEGVPGFLNGMIKALTVTDASGATLLEPQADLTVNFTEFTLGMSGSIAAGQNVIRFNNAGAQVHEAYLVKLNDGVTAEDYLNTPPTEIPPAASLGGITGITPGAHQYVSVSLEPGNYALFCFFPDPASHAPHFVLGMVQEFTVK
jgi:limonene-1,2-epoxide hydrolase